MSTAENNLNTTLDAEGNISISNDVVATIAAIAAKSVDGVADMLNSLTGGFAEFLGKKNPSKGVKVTITDREVKIDMFVVVEYGAKIPDVAWEIQEKTKTEVESMTGLTVTAVNVNVEGVNMSGQKENEQPTAETAADETADTSSEEE